MKIISITITLLSLIILNGCVSLASFEEGRTLGEGNSELGVSANFTTSPDVLGPDIDLEGDIYFIPMVELNYKYGVVENFDIGVRANTVLNFGAYAKYQIVGDRTSEFALSPGIEFSTFAGLGYAIHLPVYTSFHPNDLVSIYFNPKFVYQLGIVEMTEPVTYFGGNFGFLVGRRHKFGMDIGLYSIGSTESTSRASLLNIGIGGRFRFGDSYSHYDGEDDIEKISKSRKRR